MCQRQAPTAAHRQTMTNNNSEFVMFIAIGKCHCHSCTPECLPASLAGGFDKRAIRGTTMEALPTSQLRQTNNHLTSDMLRQKTSKCHVPGSRKGPILAWSRKEIATRCRQAASPISLINMLTQNCMAAVVVAVVTFSDEQLLSRALRTRTCCAIDVIHRKINSARRSYGHGSDEMHINVIRNYPIWPRIGAINGLRI